MLLVESIGGSRGGAAARAPPTGSISFVFTYVFAEKCTRWRLAPPPPPTGRRPPNGKSWIRHWKDHYHVHAESTRLLNIENLKHYIVYKILSNCTRLCANQRSTRLCTKITLAMLVTTHSVPHNSNSLISNYRLFRRPPSAPKITPLTQC